MLIRVLKKEVEDKRFLLRVKSYPVPQRFCGREFKKRAQPLVWSPIGDKDGDQEVELGECEGQT